jgi:DNA topoisomerase-2
MKSSKPKSINEPAIEELYKKKSHHEHVLTMPDSYIGSVESDIKEMCVFDDEQEMIVKKDISFVPGLYKIVDEVLVNARDHKIRDKTCTTIKVTVDKSTGFISVWNDGAGIRVEWHNEHKVYAPELIFGHLLTSSNYEQKGKIVGGKNGYGAKLANIYSTEFYINTVDNKNKKHYCQKFYNNMYGIDPPVINDVPASEKPFTEIKFKPDFKRFNIKGLTDDMVALIKKRVYDIAACTDKTVKVYFNNKLIKINSFDDYVGLYYKKKLNEEMSYAAFNNRWKVAAIYDPNAGFGHVSFVNGIWTYKGGTHVTYILEQITKMLVDHIKEKHKNLVVKPSLIRDNLTLYIDCMIEDPAFSSQTKEDCTSKISSFGSTCDVTPGFIKKLVDSGIVEDVVKLAQFKAMDELKKTDGKKVANLRDVIKLHDAEWAGTRKSAQCKLILTEGDSAKAFALAGLEVIGREKYGVFPLRGKLLNVREATAKQLLDNKEFANIKKIMGLKQNKKYDDVSKLRYGGGILILTDQDVDGSHIKGLIVNLFHRFWPSLLKIDGFIEAMSTPIIKAYKKSDSKKTTPKIFYAQSEYDNWLQNELHGDISKWTVKYYKGLGTSSEKEAKESFNDFDKRVVKYVWDNIAQNTPATEEIEEEGEGIEDEDEAVAEELNNVIESETDDDEIDDDDINDINSSSYNAITLAFEKAKANDRKNWLLNYDKDIIVEPIDGKVTYNDFVHKELIHFSNYNNERSIPSMCDGQKPSNRKIIFASFKRKLFTEEIKVAQFGAYVAEHTEYHHGEVSLQESIIKMAQNFVGAKNINLLEPIGNFGYRRGGGEEAASARYIFTKLNPLTSYLFRSEDEQVYKYHVVEGSTIEPVTYAPILPLVLINGTHGIGTGFSTKIPCHNPKDIANNILRMLDGKEPSKIHPWYNGFSGTITNISEGKYQSTGTYTVIDSNTISITELPIGTWTGDYDLFLKSCLVENKQPTKTQFIESYRDLGGNNSIKFEIKFWGNTLHTLLKNNTLLKIMKLSEGISLTNMYLHNEQGTITKYDFIEDIFYDFYVYRKKVYEQRKIYMLRMLENQMNILKYKVKFIEQKLSGDIVIEKKKKDVIFKELDEMGYPKLCNDVDASDDKKTYRYITDMSIFSLTEDDINKLNDEYLTKKNEYDTYKNKSIEEIWQHEIKEFLERYDKWVIDTEDERLGKNTINKKSKSKVVIKTGKSVAKAKPTNKPKVVKIKKSS